MSTRTERREAAAAAFTAYVESRCGCIDDVNVEDLHWLADDFAHDAINAAIAIVSATAHEVEA